MDSNSYKQLFASEPLDGYFCRSFLENCGFSPAREALDEMVRNEKSEAFNALLKLAGGAIDTYRVLPPDDPAFAHFHARATDFMKTIKTVSMLRTCTTNGQDAWKHLIVRVEVPGKLAEKMRFFSDLAEIVSADLYINGRDYDGRVPNGAASVIFWLRSDTDIPALVDFLEAEKPSNEYKFRGAATLRYQFESKALWKEITPVFSDLE